MADDSLAALTVALFLDPDFLENLRPDAPALLMAQARGFLTATNELTELGRETATAVAWLSIRKRVEMPCEHSIVDLIGGKGAITRCGKCLAKKRADAQREGRAL